MQINLKDIKAPKGWELTDPEATIEVGDQITDKVIKELIEGEMDRDKKLDELVQLISVMHHDPEYDWESVQCLVIMIRWGLDALYNHIGEERFKEFAGEELYTAYRKNRKLKETG
jgi:hypothetical protein